MIKVTIISIYNLNLKYIRKFNKFLKKNNFFPPTRIKKVMDQLLDRN